MPGLTLVIGNRNYSSWSMRPWIAMRHTGIAFEEVRIPLYTADAKQAILRYGPAGKVPVLIAPGATVWESLAILEYLAESHPDRRLWPAATAARAHARAISAEMHAGFAALRTHLPMNLRRRFAGPAGSAEVTADIARVQGIWTDCLDRYGGPFLFGTFTNADAMFAPVAARFITYSVALSAPCAAYVAALRALPAMEEWYGAALQETEVLPQFERAS